MDDFFNNLGQAWQNFTGNQLGYDVVAATGLPGAAWATYQGYQTVNKVAGESYVKRADDLVDNTTKLGKQLEDIGNLPGTIETAGLVLMGGLALILVLSRR